MPKIYPQKWTDHEHGVVVFIDHRENHHSVLAQPRDIEIVDGPNLDSIREDIAVHIRIAQGANPMGVRKNLKWS